MGKRHRLALAVLLALAALWGFVALSRTAHPAGAVATRGSSLDIAARERALTRAEAALRRMARRRPPQLPPIPRAPAPLARSGSVVTPGAAPRRIVYVRPPPIVIVRHHANDDGARDGGDD